MKESKNTSRPSTSPCDSPGPDGLPRGLDPAVLSDPAVQSDPAVLSDAAVLSDIDGAILVFPAAVATAAALDFLIRHSSGLVHAVMPSHLLDTLRIPDQPVLSSEGSGIPFTVAVDAATGIGTGISAADRAHTLRVLADPDTTPGDLVRPGHVLPIRCADGPAEPRCWERAVELVSAQGHRPVAVAARLVDGAGETLDDASAASFALWHGIALEPGQPARAVGSARGVVREKW